MADVADVMAEVAGAWQKWQVHGRSSRSHGRTGRCTDQDEDSVAIDMAEVAEVVAQVVAEAAGYVTGYMAEVAGYVTGCMAQVADALTRMKTAMLLTWQKWQIQPTGTTSSIRLSQLLVSRPYSALASVLPGIQPAEEEKGIRVK